MGDIGPCPFCGSKISAVEYNASFPDPWSVKCISCEARGPRSNVDDVAIFLWNGRRAGRSTAQAGGAEEAEARNRAAAEQELERYRQSGPWPEFPFDPLGE